MTLERWAQELIGAPLAERRKAAEHLAHLGEEARGAAVPLVRGTADGDERVREWCVAALEGIGEPDRGDIGALAELVGPAEGRESAYWAATLLGRSGAAAGAALTALVEAVERHPQAAVRQRAAWALGKMGPAAAAARPALTRAASSDDPRLARVARRALDQIEG